MKIWTYNYAQKGINSIQQQSTVFSHSSIILSILSLRRRRLRRPQPLPVAIINDFTPVPSMAGPIRTKHPTPPTSVVHAPRPPNAWIIYRSEKTKMITCGAAGQPAPAQGVVSKMISAMWKAEPPETRAIYERRADEKKAEHQKQYPGYRFQPKKKEEKEAARVKRKQEKDNERLAKRTRSAVRVTSASVVPVTIANAAPVLYVPHTLYPQVDSSQSQQQVYAQYGPFGTSPPLSISSSPNGSSPLSDTAYPSDDQQVAQSSNNGVNLQACHASHSLVQSNDNNLFGTTSSSLMTSSVMTSTTTLSTQDWHSGQSSASNTSVRDQIIFVALALTFALRYHYPSIYPLCRLSHGIIRLLKIHFKHYCQRQTTLPFFKSTTLTRIPSMPTLPVSLSYPLDRSPQTMKPNHTLGTLSMGWDSACMVMALKGRWRPPTNLTSHSSPRTLP